MAKRTQDAKDGHPYAFTKSRCLPAGMPSAMFTPPQLPFQIIEEPNQITVLFEEFSVFRIIRMNEAHDPDADPSFMGDSVGHWEGDTLVVDTVAVSQETTLRGVIPHSDKLHLVERIRRSGPGTLEIEVTADDAKTFDGPWVLRDSFQRVPRLRLTEYICTNDRNRPDEAGWSGIQLPGG